MTDLTPDEKFKLLSDFRAYMEKELEDVIKHTKPSPDTLRMFEDVNKKIENLRIQDEISHNKLFDLVTIIKKQLDAQDEILKPIKATYDGVSFIGTNGMKFLIFLSVASGLIFGWFAFLKPFVKKISG